MYLAVYYLCMLTAGSSTCIVGLSTCIVGQLFVCVFVQCFLARDSDLLGLLFQVKEDISCQYSRSLQRLLLVTPRLPKWFFFFFAMRTKAAMIIHFLV